MDTQSPQAQTANQNQQQTAVPYTPPPPPTADQSHKAGRSPIVNIVILIAIISLGSFMMYNFLTTQLTQLAGKSVTPASPSPVVENVPSPSPTLFQSNTP